jgi:hypothetical protein
MTFISKEKAASTVTTLLNDVVANINDMGEGEPTPADTPVNEFNATINFKSTEGITGTVLASYNPEKGLDVYARYNNVENYNRLGAAFQEEVDSFMGESPELKMEGDDE